MGKLIAFGDSFTWGSELKDEVESNSRHYSHYTWPALLAKENNQEYHCLAKPGAGNHTIARNVLANLDTINSADTVIVNWTYIDRWDYYNLQDNKWHTVRPSSNTTTLFDRYYYKYFQSELWDKFESLKLFVLVYDMLNKLNIKLIMTCNDPLVFDTKFHAPKYITVLQDTIKDKIQYFEDRGFYRWAKFHKFPLGPKNSHPLEEAHQKAFEYINEFT